MSDEMQMQILSPSEGKFLSRIEWNYEEFKKNVQEIAKQYEGLQYTEEQIKDAKEDRAKLNGMKKDISARRIAVKKAIMAPYDEFEKEVKEVESLIDEQVTAIDTQVKEYENKVKEAKKKALEDYFNEINDMEDLKIDVIWDFRWLNATTSMKKAKEEIASKVNGIREGLNSLASTNTPYMAEAKDVLFKTGDFAKAFAEHSRLSELHRKEEERKAKLEAEKAERERLAREAEAERAAQEAAQPVEVSESESLPWDEPAKEETAPQPVIPAPQPQEQPQKMYRSSFTIRGTKEQIMSVKAFILEHGIEIVMPENKATA